MNLTSIDSLDKNLSEVLPKFEEYFELHGAGGYKKPSLTKFSEFDKMRLTPLVFYLIPVDAFRATPDREKMKPKIRNHLHSIGVDRPSEDLVSIIKWVCEQIIGSNIELSKSTGSIRRRKSGVSDLRAQGLYQRMSRSQNHRCVLCGMLLNQADSVELDHIIPYYLVGDVADGSNWRLLCGRCNNGKSAYFSVYQMSEAWNWIRHSAITTSASGILNNRTRYATLALNDSTCANESCNENSRTSEILVELTNSTGLPVVENLVLRCERHGNQDSNPGLEEF